MGILTVNTGPLAGKQFDGLLDYMDAQYDFQHACQHVNRKRINGTCGNGIGKKAWSREVCPDCNACLTDNTMTAIPDYEDQKRQEREFWEEFRPASEGEHPYWWLVLRHADMVGIMCVASTSSPHRTIALKNVKESLGISKLLRTDIFMPVVKIVKDENGVPVVTVKQA
jgi:hypothetical protein